MTAGTATPPRWRGKRRTDRAARSSATSCRRTGDHVLLKHRYSAFDHTALELLLEAKSTERVLVMGAATEGCVVQTALDAREHGLKATILADACATTDAELESTALRYAQDVGGIRVQRLGAAGR